jgi:hypothetical protein
MACTFRLLLLLILLLLLLLLLLLFFVETVKHKDNEHCRQKDKEVEEKKRSRGHYVYCEVDYRRSGRNKCKRRMGSKSSQKLRGSGIERKQLLYFKRQILLPSGSEET